MRPATETFRSVSGPTMCSSRTSLQLVGAAAGGLRRRAGQWRGVVLVDVAGAEDEPLVLGSGISASCACACVGKSAPHQGNSPAGDALPDPVAERRAARPRGAGSAPGRWALNDRVFASAQIVASADDELDLLLCGIGETYVKLLVVALRQQQLLEPRELDVRVRERVGGGARRGRARGRAGPLVRRVDAEDLARAQLERVTRDQAGEAFNSWIGHTSSLPPRIPPLRGRP